VRVKCLAQEYNTMAKARTWTTRSGDECTNHEATAVLSNTSTELYAALSMGYLVGLKRHEKKSCIRVSLVNTLYILPECVV